MNNVVENKTPERPDSIALITAIENVIDDIAPGNMTPVEVLGVLELVKIRFFNDSLLID